MSTAAFVLTKDVKHLATWTQDREQLDWPRGSYRPICGGKVRDPLDTYWIGPAEQWENERRRARAGRLPVCRHCLKSLAALNEAAGGAS